MSGINKITTALTVAGMMAFPGVSEAQKLTKQTTEEAITALAGEVKKVPDSTTVNFAEVKKG
ncbi:MAG: hypothetical protein LBH96_03390, partial [Candidatus Peribacteria bacterium]|nr:hypothetical protein [Candidatus Peribacteria bacterium]